MDSGSHSLRSFARNDGGWELKPQQLFARNDVIYSKRINPPVAKDWTIETVYQVTGRDNAHLYIGRTNIDYLYQSS